MGRDPVSVGDANGGAVVSNRRSDKSVSQTEGVPPNQRPRVVGRGEVLSTGEAANETQTTPQTRNSEVSLHDVWFALPRHEQEQFGGYFSSMLLRVVQHQTVLSMSESES